jgi:hypothetical protein
MMYRTNVQNLILTALQKDKIVDLSITHFQISKSSSFCVAQIQNTKYLKLIFYNIHN